LRFIRVRIRVRVKVRVKVRVRLRVRVEGSDVSHIDLCSNLIHGFKLYINRVS
jgi:hypothetical protein